MKNWNTNIEKFTSPKEKRVWELVQMLEYGSDGGEIDRLEVKKNWETIKYQLSLETRRLWEFVLWEKRYSLPTSDDFWTRPVTVVK